jgi:hypothetical protein
VVGPTVGICVGVIVETGVAATVAVGLGVGDTAGSVLAVSPPHAAISRIKTRKIPILGVPALERAAVMHCKTNPPLMMFLNRPFQIKHFRGANRQYRRSPLLPMRRPPGPAPDL